MSLILAIEPERGQAALLTSLIRGRLSAELVLADTTEQALVAIGDRVPDLVLIPALLSPQEDAALAGALRMIAAAAQVQMLTIPLLAAPAPPPERRGLLAKWRRGRNASPSPSGCDPAVFADQIAAYLAETAEEHAADPVLETVAEIPTVREKVAETPVETIEVKPPAASAPLPVAPIVPDAPIAPVPYVPRSFALIDWQHAGGETAEVSDPPLALSDAQLTEVEGLTVSDAQLTKVEGLVVSDALLIGVEELTGVEGSAATELFDDPMVRAIQQFVAAPEVADPVLVEEPIAQPIHEVAAAPVGNVPLTGVEGFALTDAPSGEGDRPAPDELTFSEVEEVLGVEGLALSDARFIGVEGPIEAIGIVEAEPVGEAIVDEPVAHPVEDVIVARTVAEVVVPVETLDEVWIHQPATASLSVASVVEVARVAASPVKAVHEVVASPIVEDKVVADFDETPVYELSLDELASDAALMASIDAMMAPRRGDRREPQTSGPKVPVPGPRLQEQEHARGRQGSGPPSPSLGASKPQERPEAIVQPEAIRQADPVRVSRRAVEMPAARELAPSEWSSHLQTEPDPLFFFDAEPASSPLEARVPRGPVAPVAAAQPAAKPEWVELIESLRKDIERLKAERAEPASSAASRDAAAPTVSPAVATTVATASARAPGANAVRKAKRSNPASQKTPRPAQDEWGLFDPEQCGFASLLAKLSEITDGNDSGSSSRELNH